MSSSLLYGWDSVNAVWVKLVCNAAGKLIIDPSEILEDAPTDNEVGKAPTSNWAFDHKANAAAHHARYTDAEAELATKHWLETHASIELNTLGSGDRYAFIDFHSSDAVDYNARLMREPGINGALGIVQTGTGPATFDGVNVKTHAANAAAHHARYTDAEAIAAVGYNGTKYWSCSGIHFDAVNPDTNQVIKSIVGFLQAGADGISLVAQVLLPHGATVTSVVVKGNAAAAAETWSLQRSTISDRTVIAMAGANINTADSTIISGVIDNSLYSYFIYTSSIDTNDEIWGASITYTL